MRGHHTTVSIERHSCPIDGADHVTLRHKWSRLTGIKFLIPIYQNFYINTHEVNVNTNLGTLELMKSNIIHLMKKRNLNRAQLSRAAGYKNINKVTTVLNGNSLPSIDFAARIADALDAEVGDLFRKHDELQATEFTIQPADIVEEKAANLVNAMLQSAHRQLIDMGNPPTIDAVSSWWQEHGGRLEACDQLAPHFDLVSGPKRDGSIPTIHKVGYKSLTAQTLKSHDTDMMAQFLRTLDEADLEGLQKCITTVSHSGIGLLSPQTRIVDMPGMVAPMEVSFMRLMLPVTDSDGTPYVLNFSTLVSESKLRNKSGFLQ